MAGIGATRVRAARIGSLGPRGSTELIGFGLRAVFWSAAALCLPAVGLMLSADPAASRRPRRAADDLS